MVKIFKHMKSTEWIFVAVCFIFIIWQVQLDLKLPDYMSKVTLLVQAEGTRVSDILSEGGKMLLCALGSLALSVAVGFFASQIAARFSMIIREKVYDKVMTFSDKEINKFSTASLVNRSTNDITQIQMIVTMGLQVIIKAPIMAGMAIHKISTKSFEWSLLTGIVIAFILLVILSLMLYALPKFKNIQWLTDNLNDVTRENLTGIQVVRAYNAENFHENKFSKANDELTNTNLKAHMAMSFMNPAMNLGMNALTLGIYWIGAVLINNVTVTGAASIENRMMLFSDMIVFMSYAMQVVMAFVLLVMIFIMLPRASVSAKRINAVLDTDVSLSDGEKTMGAEGMEGVIEFKNVSFKYPDAADNVLTDINFKAEKGQTVAIIGATGSGKSTLINLIPRLYDATEGEVLVDGINVKDYKIESLNAKIGFVTQKAVLLSGTVESNIRFGSASGDITDESVKKAVSIAQATEFVENEDCGYDGFVAQGGSNFSGGQKQRLSIARAVAKKPEIYIFDDSFSALDYRTDKALRSALKKESSGVTSVIVAQRIGTIKDADLILVIDDGSIVGAGTHNDLMKSCTVYQEIAYSQLSKEELGA